MMEYFSDEEKGIKTRVQEIITKDAWGGIVATITSLISRGALANSFPDPCPDGGGIVATDTIGLGLAIKAEIPDLSWPLNAQNITDSWNDREDFSVNDTLTALDLIQFCYMHVAKPFNQAFHKFFNHHHLSFNIEDGKQDFLDKINRIFSRSGLAFELRPDGEIVRLAPPVFHDLLISEHFKSGDLELDKMLEEARNKFFNKDPQIRREALERLWDAWERLKTIKDSDKKRSVGKLLDQGASEPKFRSLLEDEARKLTDIGNNFQIRHTEISQAKIQEMAQVDYLFCRLLSLLLFLVKSNQKIVQAID